MSFHKYFLSSEFSDCEILLPDGKKFFGHVIILCNTFQWFETFFSKRWNKNWKENYIVDLQVLDFDPDIVVESFELAYLNQSWHDQYELERMHQYMKIHLVEKSKVLSYFGLKRNRQVDIESFIELATDFQDMEDGLQLAEDLVEIHERGELSEIFPAPDHSQVQYLLKHWNTESSKISNPETLKRIENLRKYIKN